MVKGMVHVYCGDGKGKTTAALGLAMRASGRGRRVLWTSFLKDYESGEFLGSMPFALFPGEPVAKFVFEMTREEQNSVAAEHRSRLMRAFELAAEGGFDMLVLDEGITACTLGLVGVDLIVSSLKKRPHKLEVVLTGRDPDPRIIEAADYVSRIEVVKHPFSRGVAAREGIEI